jgi:uncharacterized RDD family membrane protein YckC
MLELTTLRGLDGTPKRSGDQYEVSLRSESASRGPVPVKKPVGTIVADRWARLAAVLLDAVLLFLFWVAQQYVRYGVEDNVAWKIPLVVWLVTSLLVLVSGQIILLTLRGQTIGKMVIGIRVVRCGDHSMPGFWHGWVLRSVIPGLIYCIPIIGGLFVLMDLLSIFGRDSQCLHDVIADTKVVDA